MKPCKFSLIIALFINACVTYAIGADNPQLDRVTIADRLLRPWDIAFPNAQTALVTEKEGTIVRVNLLTGEKQPLSGLPTDVNIRNRTGLGDNSGLFGIKLDPEFANNQWIYFSYASADEKGNTTTKVVRAKLKETTLSNIETLLIALPRTNERYHYGGGLVFGADRKLYITVGERLFTEADQPDMPIAQDYADMRGKIYRINPDGSIPNDNPSFSSDAIPGLYAVGIRAAQGLTVHPQTQQIWFSEHGTRQGDEVNLLSAGSNYGWPVKTTGGYRATDYQPPQLAERQFTSPKWSWETTVAPTGLHFYVGAEFSFLNGSLLLAGLSRGSFWQLRLNKAGTQITGAEEWVTAQRVRLRNVKQAPDGKLYVLTDEANGRLMRIIAAPN